MSGGVEIIDMKLDVMMIPVSDVDCAKRAAAPDNLAAVQGIGGPGHLGIQFANKFG
jgi:D-arabinose 1-dehydrogenase-like Zn-dependent alcohol dehydrogenase